MKPSTAHFKVKQTALKLLVPPRDAAADFFPLLCNALLKLKRELGWSRDLGD